MVKWSNRIQVYNIYFVDISTFNVSQSKNQVMSRPEHKGPPDMVRTDQPFHIAYWLSSQVYNFEEAKKYTSKYVHVEGLDLIQLIEHVNLAPE
jgi:hypothetical protein